MVFFTKSHKPHKKTSKQKKKLLKVFEMPTDYYTLLHTFPPLHLLLEVKYTNKTLSGLTLCTTRRLMVMSYGISFVEKEPNRAHGCPLPTSQLKCI